MRTALWMVLALLMLAMTATSCSDDSSTGGQPEITGVKILSSDTLNYSYDNYYTKAGAGTLIAIMGNNLGNAREVTINGQSVFINPTLNTDHSIVVTIPTEENGFKLSSFDSAIPDEIQVTTNGGTATFAFKVTAPGPQLQTLVADYPRNAGDTLTLKGLNLVDINDMYITDLQAAQLDTTTWTTVGGNHTAVTKYFDISQDHHLNSNQAYETSSVVGAIVPENAPDSGTLVVECAAGTTYIAYYRLPGKPVISSVSSDMPQIGETLIITGREFVQPEVKYGDIELKAGEFSVSATQDTVYVPFKKKPAEGSPTTLTVTTPGGTASADRFYDYSTLLTTFDGDATDNGWGPNASYVDGGTADGKYCLFDFHESQSWWGTMCFFRKDWSGNSFAFSNNIPATATADELYFAYEVEDEGDFNNGSFWGYLRYTLFPLGDAENQYDNFAWPQGGYDASPQVGSFPDGPVCQDFNGVAHKNKWYRAIVPLSKFACYVGKTMSQIRTIGLDQFRIMNINQSTTEGNVKVKIDNVRVIYLPKK